MRACVCVGVGVGGGVRERIWCHALGCGSSDEHKLETPCERSVVCVLNACVAGTLLPSRATSRFVLLIALRRAVRRSYRKAGTFLAVTTCLRRPRRSRRCTRRGKRRTWSGSANTSRARWRRRCGRRGSTETTRSWVWWPAGVCASIWEGGERKRRQFDDFVVCRAKTEFI